MRINIEEMKGIKLAKGMDSEVVVVTVERPLESVLPAAI